MKFLQWLILFGTNLHPEKYIETFVHLLKNVNIVETTYNDFK
jgi:hypothetical protein